MNLPKAFMNPAKGTLAACGTFALELDFSKKSMC
jgi:hypothetical protein